MNLEKLIIAGVDRGLTYEAIMRMDAGELVDYCLEYNQIHSRQQNEDKPKKRKATQTDWDDFFG